MLASISTERQSVCIGYHRMHERKIGNDRSTFGTQRPAGTDAENVNGARDDPVFEIGFSHGSLSADEG